MNIKKSIITAAVTRGNLRTKKLVNNVTEMNKRIDESISINEQKIAQGMRRAQGIQIK